MTQHQTALLPRWTDIPTTVETNAPDTYARESGLRRRVGYRASRSIDRASTWMFTDGSGSGWHGLVVLRPGLPPRLVARHVDMPMKNVGAEMNALLLALDVCAAGEHVTVVSDYLWNIYYVLGWYDAKATALADQVRAARQTMSARRPAHLRYIHTRGHRVDGTDFGFWNDVADRLCDARVPLDAEVDERPLREHLAAALPLRTFLAP